MMFLNSLIKNNAVIQKEINDEKDNYFASFDLSQN